MQALLSSKPIPNVFIIDFQMTGFYITGLGIHSLTFLESILCQKNNNLVAGNRNGYYMAPKC